MLHDIIHFFDRLEDHIRGFLSRLPILYALISGIGVVLFWRGVWHSVDYISYYVLTAPVPDVTLTLAEGLWWDGPLSLLFGTLILLLTGVFVSDLIGNEILISGLRGEKKLAEKTELEVRAGSEALHEIHLEVSRLERKIIRLKDLRARGTALKTRRGSTKRRSARKKVQLAV